jgi:hypothetical protein
MKTLIFAAMGLFTGALATTLLGTGCGDCPAYDKLPSGAFVPNSDQGSIESDYRIEVSSDFKEVNETFTRNGVAYEIHYTVTSKEPM